MAETPIDKAIAEKIYDQSKQIVKELAQDFQITDNECKILIDQIMDWSLPPKPNPFQSYQEIVKPEKTLDIENFEKASAFRLDNINSNSINRSRRKSISYGHELVNRLSARKLQKSHERVRIREIHFIISIGKIQVAKI